MRILPLLFLLFFMGCGYHLAGGELPGQVRRIYLPLSVNATAEPLLETLLAFPVTAVLARQKGVELVGAAEPAEAVLQGKILEYRVTPLSYDSNDRISEFQASLKVHYSLVRRADGRLLWQGDLQRQESYRAAVDKNLQEDLESEAIDRMLDAIADDLVYRLVTRF